VCTGILENPPPPSPSPLVIISAGSFGEKSMKRWKTKKEENGKIKDEKAKDKVKLK
jgi:hypothetical protein